MEVLFMKLKKVLAGVMAAVTAVTASVCGLSVSAGAVSEKKEYSGSWYAYDLPSIRIKTSDDTRKVGVYTETAVGEKGTYVYVLEDIQPNDVITYYATAPNGLEYVLNIKIVPEKSYWLNQSEICYEQSGISVQKLIKEFNNDIHTYDFEHKYDGQNVTFESVHKILPYYGENYELVGDEYVNTSPFADLTEKINWRITIEPGSEEVIDTSTKNISTLKFSKVKNYTYNGKPIEPNVIIKDGSYKLVKDKDYYIFYYGSNSVGSSEIYILGKGNYTGEKRIYFNILPKKPKLSAKTNESSATLKWTQPEGGLYYQVYYSVNGGKYKEYSTEFIVTTDIVRKINLQKGKTYKFKVRAYRMCEDISNNRKMKTYYGKWSNVVTVKL